jgi:hypothetical protein
MPSCLKTDGQAFSAEKEHKVKCHMSGEEISNLIHNRQKPCRRIKWPADISGVNIEKEYKALFFATLQSLAALSGFQSSPVVKC